MIHSPSKIRSLNHSITFINDSKSKKHAFKTEKHETQHSKNTFIFQANTPIRRAKDEIIAYMKDSETRTKNDIKTYLSTERGLYNYYKAEQERRPIYEEHWNSHKKEVSRLIDIIFLVKEFYPHDFLNLLAFNETNNWKRLVFFSQ